MKNIIKIVIVMLTSISLFASANAGELSVTGTAKATYNILSGKDQNANKGLGVANELNFAASGELDNGMTWKYNVNIDTDTTQDDGGLSLTSPTLGTVAINISQGGLELSKAAAVTANGERASDTGYTEGMQEEHSIGDMNNIQYHTPAGILPFGIAIKLGYAPNTKADANASVNALGAANDGTFTAIPAAGSAIGLATSSTQGSNIGQTMSSYQVTATPIDGLSVGASYQEFGGVIGADAQKPESGSWYAKYAYGPATIAYGKAYIAPAAGTSAASDLAEYFDNTKYSLAVNANENLSVAYSMEKSEVNFRTAATATVELESSSISAAYTVGGMTLALAQVNHDNVGYTANRNVKSTVFNVSMAF